MLSSRTALTCCTSVSVLGRLMTSSMCHLEGACPSVTIVLMLMHSLHDSQACVVSAKKEPDSQCRSHSCQSCMRQVISLAGWLKSVKFPPLLLQQEVCNQPQARLCQLNLILQCHVILSGQVADSSARELHGPCFSAVVIRFCNSLGGPMHVPCCDVVSAFCSR